jgi:multimeric flavodoxin WrbA
VLDTEGSDDVKKAVILNGMHPGDGMVAAVQDMLAQGLEEASWDVQPYVLHEIEVKPCLGCFGCWLETPGRCVMHDADDVAAAVARSDLVVYLSPVTFGGYSSHLKKVMDRMIFLILPFFLTVDGETHHVPRYDDRANLLFVGLMGESDPESEEIFTALAEGNAINMSAPLWAADVIVEDEGGGAAREAVARLLRKVEVG